jgi:hypothetical protein
VSRKEQENLIRLIDQAHSKIYPLAHRDVKQSSEEAEKAFCEARNNLCAASIQARRTLGQNEPDSRSAAQKVFDIGELVEAVLLNLHPTEIIPAGMICKEASLWVKESPKIRKKLECAAHPLKPEWFYIPLLKHPKDQFGGGFEFWTRTSSQHRALAVSSRSV